MRQPDRPRRQSWPTYVSETHFEALSGMRVTRHDQLGWRHNARRRPHWLGRAHIRVKRSARAARTLARNAGSYAITFNNASAGTSRTAVSPSA